MLNPQAAAVLAARATAGADPITLEDARRRMDAAACVECGPGPDVARVGENRVGDVRCRVYQPTPGRRLPVVVYLHGGGWMVGSLDAALLVAVANPCLGFDAIVVGEYERAFCGAQLLRLMPLLERHGVQVWLPELDGPFDASGLEHRATIRALGAHSRREALRARRRTTAAMQAQARRQGRYLGGRPPYGYRLVDAGPHPNAAHAAWGRRLHRLDLDPQTAPHVRWIFAPRLAGHSTAGIAVP